MGARPDPPILLTGFEPFGEHAVNSSWNASRIVAAQMPGLVRAVRLPVDYEAAWVAGCLG